MARKKQTQKAKLIADQAAALAEYAAKALVAAEQVRINTKAVERFPLDDDERATVAELPALAPKLKKKLLNDGGPVGIGAKPKGLGYLAQYQAGVAAAEAEGVGHRHPDPPRARLVGHVAQGTFRVRVVQVDRRRHRLALQRRQASDGVDGGGAA